MLSIRYLLYCCTIWLFCIATSPLPAQNRVFDTLYHTDSLQIRLEMDVRGMLRDLDKKHWWPATMSLWSGTRLVRQLQVEVAVRGKSRLKICETPPVKIRFINSNDGVQKDTQVLKIVSTCNAQESSNNVLLKEYLVYRMYNVLTPASFRVKFTTLCFTEKGRKRAYSQSMAFVLEDENTLLQRLNVREYAPTSVVVTTIDSTSLDRISIFQFMIGNTDWAPKILHNTKFVKQAEPPRILAIPYDFDYSGVVAADYAVPAKGLPIKEVRERYYMGLCRSETQLRSLLNEFWHQQENLLKVCTERPELKTGEQTDMQAYLRSFFYLLRQDDVLQQEIFKHCNTLREE